MWDLQLPPDALPWPDRIEEPHPLRTPPALDIPDGRYFSRHPSGQLRLLANVRKGRLTSWLRLEEGREAGYLKLEGPSWFAQRYDPAGQLEDFSRDDDSSKPYPAAQGFEEWARALIEGLSREPELPEGLRPRAPRIAGRFPPRPDRYLSGSGEPPPDLEDQWRLFAGRSWHSPYACYRYLLDHLAWDPAQARDFTNFATAACAAALHQPAAETFLYPSWDQPGPCGEGRLADVPLYTRVLEAALALGDRRHDFRGWVRCLAECSNSAPTSQTRLPAPIVWTVPPPGLKGFPQTMVCVDLLLRQEATRQAVLAGYLGRVDRERFFTAAALAGAFLQGPYVTGDLYEGAPAALGDLVRNLQAPSRTRDAYATPLLVQIGEWVHRHCSERKPQPEDKRVLHFLGWFINERSPLLRACLQHLRRGEPYWASYFPITPGWPPHALEFSEVTGGALRERADQFQARLELEVRLSDFDRNRFLHRAEVAGRYLAGTRPDTSSLALQSRKELRAYLGQAAGKQDPLFDSPGEGYLRMVGASAWALDPRPTPELSARLAHFLVSAF